MKRNVVYRLLGTILAVAVLISFTACSGGSALETFKSKSLDVVLWNTNNDRFPEASGVELMEYAAKRFKDETDISVNFITIEASNQEDYYKKRIEVLLGKNQPEMLLFNTRNQDELLVIESMKNELLPLADLVDNFSDVFDGMKDDHYSALAFLVYGNILNSKLVSELGYDATAGFIPAGDLQELYMGWAEKEGSELNLFDYLTFTNLGFSRVLHIENKEVRLDTERILEGISDSEAFIAALPERRLSKDDALNILTGTNKAFLSNERDGMIASAHLRPINMITSVAFNAYDMRDFSSRINASASGVVIGDYSPTAAIGFGILDNNSKEQEYAIEFANFLLSPEFQEQMQTYSNKNPNMSGSVLKSFSENQQELARTEALLVNGAVIPEAVIEAHAKMSESFNEVGAIRRLAETTIGKVLFEELYQIATEQIWGTPLSEESLRAQLKRLEERLNLMINE